MQNNNSHNPKTNYYPKQASPITHDKDLSQKLLYKHTTVVLKRKCC